MRFSPSLLDAPGRRFGSEDAGEEEEEEKEDEEGAAQGFLLSLSSSRCSHSEIWTFFCDLCLWQALLGVSVSPEEYKLLGFSWEVLFFALWFDCGYCSHVS